MTGTTPGREREALLEWLGDQRAHVLRVLKDLSEEDLRRPVLPTGWTCLAMVNHLAIDDERFWFRGVAAGGPLPDDTDWQVPPDEPAETVLDLYRREIAASDAVLAPRLNGTAPKCQVTQGRHVRRAHWSAACSAKTGALRADPAPLVPLASPLTRRPGLRGS